MAGEPLSLLFMCVIYQDGSFVWWKLQPAIYHTAI